MRKEYVSPEVEIEKFLVSVNAIFTNSSENGFEDDDTGENVEW